MLSLYQYPCPPQNYIAEELLLGSILIYPTTFPYILPFIKKEYFFLECNQVIYFHLIIIYQKNKLYPLDLLYYLSDTKNLYQIGGINKIIDIMKQAQVFIVSKSLNIYIQELIQIITLNYIKRLMIQYGQNIIQLAYIKKISNYQLYNKASSYLDSTEKKIPKNNIISFESLIKNFLLNIQYPEYQKKTNKNLQIKTILQTGFKEIDDLISNLSNGDLIVIAGRPSIGKTSLAINLVCNILIKQNIGLCFFSLEMSKQQILNKFIAIYCNIPIKKIIFNHLDYNQWKQIKNFCEKLLKNYIYINDYTDISIDYIEYTSKLLKKENSNICLIIIDYLQLIQVDTEYKNKNRVQELSYITRKLKLLAQNLSIPIITLSQLNRSIETRNNKQPILSDLKESGCIDKNNNILLLSNNINKKTANIKSLIKDNNKNLIIATLPKLNNKFEYKNFPLSINKKINIKLEYIFIAKFYQKLLATYNHKFLYNFIWINLSNILDNSYIFLIQKKSKIKKIYNNHLNTFIKSIKILTYSIVYDIQKTFLFHFILSQNIIVHNSIEQDADIVMILYKEDIKKHEQIKYTNTDIMICKNRNGPTGSSQLYFSPESTKFYNISDTKINKLI